jgi:hypothetical protein
VVLLAKITTLFITLHSILSSKYSILDFASAKSAVDEARASDFFVSEIEKAADEARTRDLFLGKETFYQLNYRCILFYYFVLTDSISGFYSLSAKAFQGLRSSKLNFFRHWRNHFRQESLIN